jgi:hypothetical protein
MIFLYILLLGSLFADENRLLFYGNCIACHGEVRNPSAPHLSEVKGYYMMAYPKKEEFIANMAKWISNPNEGEAKLTEAVEKYNLMPYLSIDIDTLSKIATYIYENDDFGVANNL